MISCKGQNSLVACSQSIAISSFSHQIAVLFVVVSLNKELYSYYSSLVDAAVLFGNVWQHQCLCFLEEEKHCSSLPSCTMAMYVYLALTSWEVKLNPHNSLLAIKFWRRLKHWIINFTQCSQMRIFWPPSTGPTGTFNDAWDFLWYFRHS